MSKKHGAHGGAWKVAYADFTTAMMALFLCLWLTSQDTKIKEAVERAFRNPFSAVTKESTGIIPNQGRDATATYKQQGNFQSVSAVEMETMRRVSDDLARILRQQDEWDQTIQIDVTGDGLRINVFDRVHKPIFEPGSDTFTEYGAWVFSTLAWEIARYRAFKIELEGHTEATTETGRETHSKWELSTERANAVRRKLVQEGVRPAQIYKVSGFADTVPIPSLPPNAEANRRVTVLLKLKASMDALSAATAQPPAHDGQLP